MGVSWRDGSCRWYPAPHYTGDETISLRDDVRRSRDLDVEALGGGTVTVKIDNLRLGHPEPIDVDVVEGRSSENGSS